MIIQYLMKLVDGFLQQMLGFDLRSDYVGFVVCEVSLGSSILRILLFPKPVLLQATAPQSLISPSPSLHRLDPYISVALQLLWTLAAFHFLNPVRSQ